MKLSSYFGFAQDTIVGIATPPGVGGVAIIRLSGPKATLLASKVLKNPLFTFETHRARLATLVSSTGQALDKALVLYFQAPNSFTGEETVELHCHGGAFLAQKVVEALVEQGARTSMAGEFSLRAFLNGKVDLAQAEAIQDLIGARNDKALKVAEAQLEGRLSLEISSLHKEGARVAAILEAWVDFPEEGIEFESEEGILAKLEQLLAGIDSLLASYHEGRLIHDGVSLCLLGAPNVGKSSLMNALLGKDRAIVSHIPGTTRDTIEEDLRLEGIQCRLTDTAGIRQTNELIEGEGVKRSLEAIKTADIVLVVLDASCPNEEEAKELLKEAKGYHVCLVWNKMDLKKDNVMVPTFGIKEAVFVSAKTKEGLASLKQAVHRMLFREDSLHRDEVMITNVRHKEALLLAKDALHKVVSGLKEHVSPEFITFDMREALHHLGKVIGRDVTEDILTEIFSQFCIGK